MYCARLFSPPLCTQPHLPSPLTNTPSPTTVPPLFPPPPPPFPPPPHFPPISPSFPRRNLGGFMAPSFPRSDLGGSMAQRRRFHRRRQGASGQAASGGGAPSGTPGEGEEEELEGTFVWGTGVSVQDVSSKFASFVRHFREADDALHAKYSQQLDELVEMEGDTFPVDCADVYAFSAELYRLLVRYPLEVIPIFDIKIAELAADRMPMWDKHIQWGTVRGWNDIKAAYFKCLMCGHSPDLVLVDRGVIEEPRRCPWPECGALNSMTLVHNRSRFINKQMLRLQETPEDMPEGETPHTVSVFLFDSLVHTAKPGDRVEVTGVFRAVPVRVNSNQRNLRSLYRTYLDCIHIRKEEGGRTRNKGAAQQSQSQQPLTTSAGGDADDANPDAAYFSPQQVEAFRKLSRQPDIYERLARSLAPSIYELDDIKKGLLCQLFGGSVKRLSSGVQFRGDMNVLLVGDPGTSKSQLLQYVHKIAPRGIYTSGRGSSAVGLTAYVTKDPETREMVLESGALVLSDRGICCIDEFDKMSDNARSMLHEVMEQQTVSVAKAGIIATLNAHTSVMEQQTVSVAKAGIIATLNARTSVLACANPSGSRYNPRLSVIDNIQLPPTLLSRFDLIYLVLDKAEEQSDRRLARHLVALHYKNPEASAAATIDVATLTSYITYARMRIHPELSDEAEEELASAAATIDVATLTSYITYARTRIHPELSDEAAEELVNAYVELRGRGLGRKVITATPRQLESLIRISEALARLKLASTVTHEDVTEARRLLDVAMQQSATDPTTGTIGVTHKDVTEARRLLDVAMQQSATDPTTGTIDMDLITTTTITTNLAQSLPPSLSHSLPHSLSHSLHHSLPHSLTSPQVTHEDVTEARRLLDVAMQQSATDPTTGTIDMDLITTGVSASERAKRVQLQEALLSFLQDRATASRSSFRATQHIGSTTDSTTGTTTCSTTGTMDMDLITTGVSSSERAKRTRLQDALLSFLQERATASRSSFQAPQVVSRASGTPPGTPRERPQVWEDLRQQSSIPVTLFEVSFAY
ncbi:unnamed protein product [Closterium sp. Naga37s-1]|nr:unnamed protein product [Closterium sp. Naga37s-1]